MEKMLNEILNKLSSIDQKIDSMNKRMDAMESDINEIKVSQKEMNVRLDVLEKHSIALTEGVATANTSLNRCNQI